MVDPTKEPSLVPVQEQEMGEKAYNLLRSRELHDYQGMKVTETVEKPHGTVSSKIEVTKADGSTVEVSADDPMYKFVTADGKEITVSVGTVQHIDGLHFKAEDLGSVFDYSSMDELMEDLANKIPGDVTSRPKVVRVSVEMGKHMGNEGLASLQELVESGVVSEQDVALAEEVRQQVYELNKSGDAAAKAQFIKTFKADHPESKIQFQTVRSGVIVPVVDTPNRPTTKLFMMFGPADSGKALWTAAPGRDMPLHPDPKQHQLSGSFDEQTFSDSAKAWFDTAMLSGK